MSIMTKSQARREALTNPVETAVKINKLLSTDLGLDTNLALVEILDWVRPVHGTELWELTNVLEMPEKELLDILERFTAKGYINATPEGYFRVVTSSDLIYRVFGLVK